MRYHPSHPICRRALTLAELLVALTILVGLASLVLPLLSSAVDEAKETTTRASLKELRDVIMGRYRLDMGHKLPRPATKSARAQKPQIRYLFVNPEKENASNTFNPDTKLGWRGPYLMLPPGVYTVTGTFTSDYGENGDPALLDGWNRPIVIVESADGLHAELRSAGNDGILFTTDDLELDLY
jgi:type II secretory pathway pseudopilin PulG